jgi:hypothetical protein
MVSRVHIQRALGFGDLSMKELEIWNVIHEIKSNSEIFPQPGTTSSFYADSEI